MSKSEEIQLKNHPLSPKKDYKTLSPSRQPQSPAKITPTEDVEIEIQSFPKKRQPKRVIHCSDGIVEEYSSDEEDASKTDQSQLNSIDPKNLSWIPWMIHFTWLGGSKAVEYCDAAGEKLAWFFGITSPKYYYEIQEFKRMKKLEQERKAKEESEFQGWKEPENSSPIQIDPGKLQTSEQN